VWEVTLLWEIVVSIAASGREVIVGTEEGKGNIAAESW